METNRTSNADNRSSLETRLGQVSATINAQNRISKSEVEEAARAAKQLCEERDAASKNERLYEIPKEMKADEDSIHQLQRKIEDSNDGLEQLRTCSDEENAVAMLQKQIETETSRLGDSCKVRSERSEGAVREGDVVL